MLKKKDYSSFLLFVLFIGSIHLSMVAQNPLSLFKTETLDRANTAKDANYLTPEEKKLIQLTNLARMNGQEFAEKILIPYLQGEKTTGYTRSLLRTLESIRNMDLLQPNQDLYLIAREHATNSGDKGTTGHQQFDRRYGQLLGPFTEVAENCAYGYEDAIDILIRLLIDEGVRDLGHRKNLLNPNFNSIGVSIQPHKKYNYNCVMSFGNKRK